MAAVTRDTWRQSWDLSRSSAFDSTPKPVNAGLRRHYLRSHWCLAGSGLIAGLACCLLRCIRHSLAGFGLFCLRLGGSRVDSLLGALQAIISARRAKNRTPPLTCAGTQPHAARAAWLGNEWGNIAVHWAGASERRLPAFFIVPIPFLLLIRQISGAPDHNKPARLR